MRRLLPLLLALCAGAAPPARTQTAPVTVVVVRHAEKGPGTPDPPLTEAGVRRAEALARVLTDVRPAALFASEFRRTQQTLAPLAAATGVPVTVVPAGRMDSLLARLRALPPGSRAVVASHSNLVHLIVAGLSGARVAPLADADYDRLIVVTVPAAGPGEAVVLRYGEPSGGGAAGAPPGPRPPT